MGHDISINAWSDSAFNGTVVKLALSSLLWGSLSIGLTALQHHWLTALQHHFCSVSIHVDAMLYVSRNGKKYPSDLTRTSVGCSNMFKQHYRYMLQVPPIKIWGKSVQGFLSFDRTNKETNRDKPFIFMDKLDFSDVVNVIL